MKLPTRFLAKKLATAVILASMVAATTARADYIDLTDYKKVGGLTCEASKYDISSNNVFLTSTCFVQYLVEDVVSFDWLFSPTDTVGNDYAWFFLGVTQEYTTLADRVSLGGAADSGWQTYNFGYRYSGMIQFGVKDWNPQNSIDSTLTIKNVKVPEPSTLALFGIGLLGMGLARRKKA